MNRSVPENELLICIARAELDANKQAKLRCLLEHELDWDYVFATASYHGLIPLLHKNLRTSAGAIAPSHVLARLKREWVANSQSVLHLIARQLTVYNVFKEHGIATAIFKGPALAQMAYGDIALRQAGDIDILISPEHFVQAKQLLESLGYQMSPQLSAAQLSSHLRFHCEIQFMRDDWFTVVDLHWGIAPQSFVFNLKVDEIMSRLQPMSLMGTEIATFGTEDLILYQSMHGAKHLWRRLEWICSLAELLRTRERIAWNTVIERAAQCHVTRMLGLGLRLVERFSDVNLPSDVLATVDGNNSMGRLADEIHDQIFTPHAGLSESTDTNLYNLKIMDRKRDALISTLRALFVPTLSDWKTLALPEPLHSLYYAFRPLRLSKVYSASLWRKLFH
jgi:hypothetical protein